MRRGNRLDSLIGKKNVFEHDKIGIVGHHNV